MTRSRARGRRPAGHRVGLLAGMRLGVLAGALLAASCGRSRSPREPLELDVLSPAVPERLDPNRDMRLGARILFVNAFDSLVRDEASGTVPGLAESWTNPDPSTWRFVLQPNVLFHDGSPLTAADVVASFERAREAGSAQAGNLAEVASFTAEDERRILVRSKGLVSLLPALSGVLVSKAASDGRYVGTGPFRVASFVPGRSATLARFEGYHGARPQVDTVRFQRFDDPEMLLPMLAASRRPVVVDPPRAAIEAARKRPDLKVTGELKGAVTYLAFQLAGEASRTSPFLDVRVRRAVQLAVDAERTLRDGTPLGGLLASQVVPPGIFGYDPGIKTIARNLPAARALLAEAGLRDGFPTTLDSNTTSREVAELVARDLTEAGIRTEVRSHDSASFQALINRGTPFYLYSWLVGQEAVEALKNFFATPDPARAWGLRNRVGYTSPEFDRLIGTALQAENPELRLGVLRQAVAVLTRDLPWVPLFSIRSARIYPADLPFRSRADGMIFLGQARLAAETR